MSFLTEKFANLKQETNLKIFLNQEEIKKNGKDQRKIELKGDLKEEDEKKIRQMQKETAKLQQQQQQLQDFKNHVGLGEKILKAYFAYKMASLLCRTFFGYGDYRRGLADGMAANTMSSIDKAIDDKTDELTNGMEDAGTDRATQIEHMRDQFDQINSEAKELGIADHDIFGQEDKNKLTELADASRNNDIEQYAAKCQDLGLDATEARASFEKGQTLDTVEQEKNKDAQEQELSQGYEM